MSSNREIKDIMGPAVGMPYLSLAMDLKKDFLEEGTSEQRLPSKEVGGECGLKKYKQKKQHMPGGCVEHWRLSSSTGWPDHRAQELEKYK